MVCTDYVTYNIAGFGPSQPVCRATHKRLCGPIAHRPRCHCCSGCTGLCCSIDCEHGLSTNQNRSQCSEAPRACSSNSGSCCEYRNFKHLGRVKRTHGTLCCLEKGWRCDSGTGSSGVVCAVLCLQHCSWPGRSATANEQGLCWREC